MDRHKQQKPFTSVYVAVDFGTTYSGISFQKVKNGVGLGQSLQVRQWPRRPGSKVDEAKVPSKIQYRLDAQGTYVVNAWGYQVQSDDDLTFEWFKLLLLKNEELPDHLRFSAQLNKMRRRLRQIKKTAVDVISDYLTKLWEHAIDEDHMPPEGEMFKSVGITISLVPIHVILTVPAIWSDSAKEAMKLAATKSLIIGNVSRLAGVTTFQYLSEPEAAAHAYAKEIIEMSNVGETVLICDLGGGTGDCISYQVMDRDNFELKEVVPGTGAICGGSILDEAFNRLCEEMLPSQPDPKTAEVWRAILRDRWEHDFKRSFKFTGRAPPCPVLLCSQNNKNVYFHEDQLRDVFNSSVVPILVSLIRNQINSIETKTGKSPAMILLVGGFGRCPFIRQVLEKEFRTKKGRSKSARRPIDIITDPGDLPWSAISRGAVEHALKPRVGARIAQRSIGFQQKIPASVEEGGEYDEVLGDYRLPDGMSWVVKKGEEVSSSSKTLAETWVYSDLDRQNFGERLPKHVAKFYAYDGEDPPSRFGDGVGFQERGSMTLKVPVKIEDLPQVKDEDKEAIANPWVFEYDLQINCSGVSTEITAVTTGSLVSNHIKEGTKVGEVTMDLEEMGMVDRNQT